MYKLSSLYFKVICGCVDDVTIGSRKVWEKLAEKASMYMQEECC